MKSGSGCVGVGVGAPVVVATTAIPRKRSFRIPCSLLFLVAVATVLSCRSAVRRCLTYQPLDNPWPALVPPWNTTLLRLASVDANEMAERSQIEGLLDSAGYGYDGEPTHRSIVSWRRFHRLDGGRRVSRSGNGGRDPVRLWMNPARFSQLFPEFRSTLWHWSRNRRFDPGVMSELVNLVKRPIDLHRVGVPPSNQTQRRYGSCAVVGNSGILLKHDHGGLIDSHDFVIRLNNARTNGYDRNVGSKTSLAFVNSNILHLCARREGCFCHPYGAYVPMLMYICQSVHFLDYIICNVSHMAPLLITDARFDMMCSRIVKYYSLKRFLDETGKSPGEWYKVHDAKMFHYSSGMQAVMLAVGICDQVSIFGFGKSTEEKHHYHTNQKAELDLHDYEAEYALYRDLIERSQVIPFLADSGFKVPPVVMYR